MNFRGWRRITQPVFILPAVLTAALLIFAFKLGNLGDVVARVKVIPVYILLYALGFAAVYLALKALQLHLLLLKLAVRPAFRPFALAFAVGELTLTLPFGLFAQNWILSASARIRIGRSAAATVVMLLTEILVTLLLMAVIGVRGWPQFRLAMILALFMFAVVITAVVLFAHRMHARVHQVQHSYLRKALLEAAELLQGLKRLLDAPGVLAVNLLIAAGYLGALISAFFFVGRGMGLHSLGFITAASVYGFSLAVVLLGAGAVTQIGTVEVLGMLAAHEWGIGYTDGLAMMLGFRLVWTGSMWLVNLPVVLLLWRNIRPPGTAKVS